VLISPKAPQSNNKTQTSHVSESENITYYFSGEGTLLRKSLKNRLLPNCQEFQEKILRLVKIHLRTFKIVAKYNKPVIALTNLGRIK
jgi:hypothetical protein